MGQTPAYKVHGRITIEGLPYPLPTTKDLNVNPSTSQVQNSAFLSPVNTFSLTVISPGVLNQPTIDAINDGKTFRIYTYGRVDYEDVFGEPHWFTFCYAYDGTDIKEHRVAETCSRHNDDDHH